MASSTDCELLVALSMTFKNNALLNNSVAMIVSPNLLKRAQHSTIIVDSKMYSWGGERVNMPLVHDSVVKMNLISFVEVVDIPSLSWSRVPTAGIPPTAVMGYSCASINNEVFFFGGSCKPYDCYHNDTFVLNTASKEWSRVFYANEEMVPMKKIGHCMISFSSDKEDYLLVVGGFGPNSTTKPSHFVYTSVPTLANCSLTNEVHVLCVSSSPGRVLQCLFHYYYDFRHIFLYIARWTVPVVTGTRPPPLARFTLNKLPDGNRAILFGGQVIDHFGHHFTNDAYIVTYSKDSVVSCYHLLMYWPTIINDFCVTCYSDIIIIIIIIITQAWAEATV